MNAYHFTWLGRSDLTSVTVTTSGNTVCEYDKSQDLVPMELGRLWPKDYHNVIRFL